MYLLSPTYVPRVPDTIDGVLTIQLDFPPESSDLLQIAGGHVVLSKEARSIIERYSVCPTVVWTPFQMIVSERVIDCFSLKGTQIRIVDREKSEINWILEYKVIRNVVRWAFLFDPPFDFFYTDASEWLVSERLAQSLIEERSCSLKKCKML